MRELRTRSGLTLAALAERTNVSKSSWERYLNGKKFPPRTAVAAFARAVGVKPDRLLLLWDLAAQARHRAVEREADDGGAQEERGGGADATAAPAPGADALGGGPSGKAAAKGAGAARGWRALPRAFAAVSRTRRAVLVGVVTGALLLGGFTVLRAGAGSGDESEPRSGCVGNECHGLNPGSFGCDGDAYTAALHKFDDSYIELRYSPSCRAGWARISHAKPGDSARVVPVKGSRTEERAISFDDNVFSMMINAPYPASVRACGIKQKDGEAKPVTGCTEPGGAEPLEPPPAHTPPGGGESTPSVSASTSSSTQP